MRRRDLIAMLGSAAIARPFTGNAQPTQLPVIGILLPTSSSNTIMSESYRRVFLKVLSEEGFVEGQNVALDYRFANDDMARLRELAVDLVRVKPAVIVTFLPEATKAAITATKDIPIVFDSGGDPVDEGLVSNLNRPGSNATGVYPMVEALNAKRLELLHELVPGVTEIGVLLNPSDPRATGRRIGLEAAAAALGLRLHVVEATKPADFPEAFAVLRNEHVGALIDVPNQIFMARNLAGFVARDRLPSIYILRIDAVEGGLMSYGPDIFDTYRQLGRYTARVLKGEKPGDMPVWQSTKFNFVVNLKTAKALGLTIPPTLLARADEVIE